MSFLRRMRQAAQSILHMGVDKSEQTLLLAATKRLHKRAVLLDYLIRPLVGALQSTNTHTRLDD